MAALAQISPIDLGIKAAREVFARSGASPDDVGTVITGNMAQASFDAYLLPRHIGLYSGVPIETPAHMVQRVCGTGIEVLMQAADTDHASAASTSRSASAPNSMSRNPIAAYTHRGGFRMGQVEFKDFLWEALMDRSANVTMGDTAENLARQYQITRAEVDAYAARSFERAMKAQESGFLAGEIAPVKTEEFAREGYNARGIKLARETKELDHDTHIRAVDASSSSRRSAPPSAACRPAAIPPRSSMARRRRSRLPAITRSQHARRRSAGSSPVRRPACRRRSWASARCRRSRPCSRGRPEARPTSTASRSTRRSARR